MKDFKEMVAHITGTEFLNIMVDTAYAIAFTNFKEITIQGYYTSAMMQAIKERELEITVDKNGFMETTLQEGDIKVKIVLT